ncbi:MAG TPA: glycosyltransferase family 2 protein [Gemmataceae bacterium]|nr:glycosyltransferase family 2 protein [Gemmataceae bacterium]
MTQRSSRRRKRGNPYRELLHLLNQRYHREWVRAELLENELAGLRQSRLWRAIAWLRRAARWLKPARPVPTPALAERAVPYVPLTERSQRPARVSIVIPFKDRLELLRNCLRSLGRSTYRRFEVVLVNNGSTQPRTHRFLARIATRPRVRVVDAPGEFNFSRLCNAGAARADGDHLLFLNNDTELLARDGLEHLLRIVADPKVGVAGATLLYPDRTIQHAGIFPRTDGLWVHPYRGQPAEGDGELRIARCVPAVTAACLLIRRELLQQIGGFDERLPLTYNDVALCTRVRERGLLVVISPHARLIHYEGLSRGYTVDIPEPSR